MTVFVLMEPHISSEGGRVSQLKMLFVRVLIVCVVRK